MIRPLAIDEMGMSGHHDCIPKLLELAQDDTTPGFTRAQSDRSVGTFARDRGLAVAAAHHGRTTALALSHPEELRIAAAQALMRIDAHMALEKLAPSGLDRKDLTLEPTDPEPNASVIRQRRYARLKLSRNLIADTTNLRENIGSRFRNSILVAASARAIGIWRPGSLLALKFTRACATSRRRPSCAARVRRPWRSNSSIWIWKNARDSANC